MRGALVLFDGLLPTVMNRFYRCLRMFDLCASKLESTLQLSRWPFRKRADQSMSRLIGRDRWPAVKCI